MFAEDPIKSRDSFLLGNIWTPCIFCYPHVSVTFQACVVKMSISRHLGLIADKLKGLKAILFFGRLLFPKQLPHDLLQEMIISPFLRCFDTVSRRPYRCFSIALKVILSLFDNLKFQDEPSLRTTKNRRYKIHCFDVMPIFTN